MFFFLTTTRFKSIYEKQVYRNIRIRFPFYTHN